MKKILISKSNNFISEVPRDFGVYLFYKDEIPVYIGKANDLRQRISSYFSNTTFGKTKAMVDSANYISFIITNSEFDSLLLEASLINRFQPKYNLILKDDKSPIYISITKDQFPQIYPIRKSEITKNILVYGPFPSRKSLIKLLNLIRKIFPYSHHKLGKKPCIYRQIGLCNPCPNYINSLPESDEKKELFHEYKSNIAKIKKLLSGKITDIRKQLFESMQFYARNLQYEKSKRIKEQLFLIDFLQRLEFEPVSFLINPNFTQDIRYKELSELKKLLKSFLIIDKLNNIECYDISHISGYSTTASMVVFSNGSPLNSAYKHFRINKAKRGSDTDALYEVATRRSKHFNDWGKPDLILVDGGKPQVKTFYNVFKSYNIPVIGYAKSSGKLIIPIIKGNKLSFKEARMGKSVEGNLIKRMIDEAHRFARRYHHHLIKKNLLIV